MLGFIKILFGMVETVDLKALIDGGATILDVRTPAEFSNGHVKGAVNIPVPVLSGQIDKVKAFSQPIITCCASGMRSAAATVTLKSNGIEAYNGGTWQSVNRYKS